MCEQLLPACSGNPSLRDKEIVVRIMIFNRVLMGITLAAIFGVEAASGQTSSARKEGTPQPNVTPTPTETRARRVVDGSSGESKSAVAEKPPSPNAGESSSGNSVKTPGKPQANSAPSPGETTGDKSTDKPGMKASEKPASPPVADSRKPSASNPISLRDEIDAARAGPERTRLQLKLVDELVAANKKPAAIAELHSIVAGNMFDPQGLYNAGNALARLGESDEAITAYRKAIDQRKGRYSRALNNLGVVLMREGRWDEAHESFLSALKLESFHYAEASYNLGRLYAARGETDLAVREWRRVLVIDPEHTAARDAIARAGSGGPIVVESSVSAKGQPSAKGSTPAKENKGMAASSEETVMASADGASSGSPRSNSGSPGSAAGPKVYTVDAASYGFLQRARSSFERGDLQDAADNYQRVISRMGGYFAPANLELSYVLLGLKRNDEALENMVRVANRDGARYPISYYHLGRMYEQKGDLKLAEELFTEAAAAYGKKNNQFLLDISRVRERQGNLKGALEVMQEFVTTLEQEGRKPAWADERLDALRQKLAAAQPK